MKLNKYMNILFYFFTIAFSLLFIGFIFNEYNNYLGFGLYIFYIFTYYCHLEYKKYILKTYYIEKYSDTREPDVAMIEDFYHSLGFTDYKCNPEVINKKDYSK